MAQMEMEMENFHKGPDIKHFKLSTQISLFQLLNSALVMQK
jgi:hypothetical protein